MGISEQSSFRFLVSNLAKRDLDITFDIAGPSNLLQHLKTEPKHATVQVGKQLQLSLFFCPLSICNLQEIRLNIKVSHKESRPETLTALKPIECGEIIFHVVLTGKAWAYLYSGY